jgi:hypothetical protein
VNIRNEMLNSLFPKVCLPRAKQASLFLKICQWRTHPSPSFHLDGAPPPHPPIFSPKKCKKLTAAFKVGFVFESFVVTAK